MPIPRAFISYSWDSEAHKAWVLRLAERLRGDGVESHLDQWDLWPADELTRYMETSIREQDFVLVVCTPRYKQKADGRSGGVGYEGAIITAALLASGGTRKFIPVLREGEWNDASPTYLGSRYYVDLRGGPGEEAEYRKLVDTLLNRRPPPPPPRPPPRDEPVGSTTEPRAMPPDPATRWLVRLDALVQTGQIGDEDRLEVLAHGLGAPPDPAALRAELAAALLADPRTARRLAWGASAAALARQVPADGRAARVHQVLAALALGMKVERTELGIRFLLVPPGTTRDGLRSVAPFYLAEAPLSEREWTAVLGGTAAPGAEGRAVVGVSVEDVQRLVRAAEARLDGGARLDLPRSREWRFAAALAPAPRAHPAGPLLRTAAPSALGLHDLRGVVWQLCVREGVPRRYELWGGSHRTRLSTGETPMQPCPNTALRSPEAGFRPVLRVP